MRTPGQPGMPLLMRRAYSTCPGWGAAAVAVAEGEEHVVVELLLLVAPPGAHHLVGREVAVVGGEILPLSRASMLVAVMQWVSTSVPSMPRHRKVS